MINKKFNEFYELIDKIVTIIKKDIEYNIELSIDKLSVDFCIDRDTYFIEITSSDNKELILEWFGYVDKEYSRNEYKIDINKFDNSDYFNYAISSNVAFIEYDKLCSIIKLYSNFNTNIILQLGKCE